LKGPTIEEIKEIIAEFNSSLIDDGDEAFAAFYEYDKETKQVFIVMEEHQKQSSFKELGETIKEKLGRRILLSFIRNNKLFDTHLE
jgi:hypothetical protein